MLLLGDLRIKKWAYRAGDEEVLKLAVPGRDEAKRARLEPEGGVMYMVIKIKKEVPTFHSIERRTSHLTGKDYLYIFESETEFHCRSFFPESTEDSL